MKLRYLFSVIFILFSISGFSQTITELLKEIERNNLELQAARQQKEQERFEAHTGIYPKPLSVNYGYFPDNQTVVDQKQTVNVTQSFYFPGVYKKMGSLAEEKTDLAELRYDALRQDVLLQAQKTLIRMVYTMKMKEQLDQRLEDARKRKRALEKKAEAGDANQLELNKARFHLLRIRRKARSEQLKREQLQEQLKKLNGGNSLQGNYEHYPVFQMMQKDSLLDEKVANLPSVQMAAKRKEQAETLVELQRSFNNPEFKIGYGSETVGNSSFRGVLAGVAIPLWSNKNKVKAAKANARYKDLNYQESMLSIRSETEEQYSACLSLKRSMEEYSDMLEQTNSIHLLKRSRELGKISIIEFFREMQYFYTLYDEYLALERDYQLARAELFKYQL